MRGLSVGVERVAVVIAVAVFVFALATPGFAQTDWICGTDIEVPLPFGGGERGANCSNSSPAWLDKYRTPGHWVPDETTPLKTVLVNMVVCRDGQGGDGWPNTPAMIADFEEMLAQVNLKYANPGLPEWPMTCIPTIPYYPTDSRIRFKLNHAYFLDNDDFNNYNSLAAPSAILDYLWATYPESKNAMNHIWTQPDENIWSGGWWGYYSQYAGESFVLTRNAMWGSSSVYTKEHVSHEYGHALGLHHTYNGEITNTSHFDFLDDLFGACPEPLMMDPQNPCYSQGGSPCSPAPGYICYLTGPCFFSNFPNATPPLLIRQ